MKPIIASSICPICRRDTPHTHTEEEVKAYRERFVFKIKERPEVCAFQMTEARGCDRSTWPAWLGVLWNPGFPQRNAQGEIYQNAADKTLYYHAAWNKRTSAIPTTINWNDWVVLIPHHGDKINIYSPEAFADTFETAYALDAGEGT